MYYIGHYSEFTVWRSGICLPTKERDPKTTVEFTKEGDESIGSAEARSENVTKTHMMICHKTKASRDRNMAM